MAIFILYTSVDPIVLYCELRAHMRCGRFIKLIVFYKSAALNVALTRYNVAPVVKK